MRVSIINLLVPTSLGLPACGQHIVNLFHLVGALVSAKHLKDIVYIPWGGTRTLPQGCTIVSWLLLLCLHIPSLSWLATFGTCPLELRESHGSWMKLICYKEKWAAEKLLCPGAPQGPDQFYWHCFNVGTEIKSHRDAHFRVEDRIDSYFFSICIKNWVAFIFYLCSMQHQCSLPVDYNFLFNSSYRVSYTKKQD